MGPRALLTSVALLTIACGSRTGLLASDLVSSEAGVDANADGAADASRDASQDTREGAAPPDAEPDVVTECENGVVTLAFGREDQRPSGFIAVDDVNIYWTTVGSTEGSVLSIPKCGGVVTTIASKQPEPGPLAVDATNVYWLNSGNFGPRMDNTGTVMKVSKGGGTPVQLSIMIAAIDLSLSADPTRLYFAGQAGAVTQLAIVGGAEGKLAQDPVTEASGFVAVDATNVYWTTTANPSTMRPGDVLAVPLGGGTLTTLASRVDSASGIAVDATSAYWVEGPGLGAGGKDSTQNLMQVPLGGGTPVTLATAKLGQGMLGTVAVDATTAYWTTFQERAPILSVPLGGGTPTTLATTDGDTLGVVVDSTSLYWAETTTKPSELGRIRRLTPK
jgi:hypothetical protein